MGITTVGGRIWKRNCDVLYKAENHQLKMISRLKLRCLHFFFQSRQGNSRTECQNVSPPWTLTLSWDGPQQGQRLLQECREGVRVFTGMMIWEATGPISSYFWGPNNNFFHHSKFRILSWLTAWQYRYFICSCEQKHLRNCCRKGEI